MTDQTPSLNEFRRAYEADNNAWWRLECGHHINLFDAALEALDAAHEAIDAMQTAHESQLARMAKERARLQRKVERQEAAQRPPVANEDAEPEPDENISIAPLPSADRLLVHEALVVLNQARWVPYSDVLAIRNVISRLEELSAAQRPPLGYVVVGRDPETGRMQTEGCIHEKRDAAEEWLRWVERYAVTGWRGEVGEVR